MAEKLEKYDRTLQWGFLPAVLGEYPDKKGGYHGCLKWWSSSSLKLRGS